MMRTHERRSVSSSLVEQHQQSESSDRTGWLIDGLIRMADGRERNGS